VKPQRDNSAGVVFIWGNPRGHNHIHIGSNQTSSRS